MIGCQTNSTMLAVGVSALGLFEQSVKLSNLEGNCVYPTLFAKHVSSPFAAMVHKYREQIGLRCSRVYRTVTCKHTFPSSNPLPLYSTEHVWLKE